VPKVYNKHGNYPPDVRYIGRGSIAGNPYVVGRDGTRDEVCDKYEALIEANPLFKKRLIAYCKGRNLLCFCKPLRCHGDYLLRISNDPDPTLLD
jgi:hypothetical protein